MKSSLLIRSSFQASRNRSLVRSASPSGSGPGLGGLGHLQAVLVGPGEEKHLISPQTSPSGQHITGDGGVGVADMGTSLT